MVPDSGVAVSVTPEGGKVELGKGEGIIGAVVLVDAGSGDLNDPVVGSAVGETSLIVAVAGTVVAIGPQETKINAERSKTIIFACNFTPKYPSKFPKSRIPLKE